MTDDKIQVTREREEKRLFIGISAPNHVKSSIRRIRHQLPEFRWVPEDNLHLTLRFIGDVDAELAERIVELLSPIRVELFILPVKQVGCFPRRGRPGIVWVGHDKGHPRLFQLQKQIEDTLVALGVEAETRAYHPHVTIARTARAKPGAVKQFVRDNRNFETAPFKVEGFTLFSSKLSSEGAQYTEEAFFSFNE